ncbi:hypothetical protein O181_128048 [Austropuccinia psidii MF-1]|uniref:Uncharacterized protein n=1 Tax=Austropuccinia psidii MF-1 TaxID=1389203 RepID=A0A9Q3Q7I4_9BASI|nr:hypothetical protein [Austropuccinia psidii MF-1]
MCLGPEGTPQISSNANPQSKFPCEFLLNPSRNPVASQDPFGQSKQPTLNIPSGSQVHVGDERCVDGGQQKRPLENVTWSGLLEGNPGLMLHQSDERYASSPLVHKEKVTGHHHPYASKPRTAHSSSSREKMVDDEDENMSPTQMKQMMNQGGTISWRMSMALSQIMSSPILKCPLPRVCLNNPRSDSKGTRLVKLTMWQNVQARRSNKNG